MLVLNVVVVLLVYNYFSGSIELFVVDCVLIVCLKVVLGLVEVCLLDYFVVIVGEMVLMVVRGLV